MAKILKTDKPEPEALAQMRSFRCDECESCRRLKALKPEHTPNPPFTHATDLMPNGLTMVDSWNKAVKDNPCEAKWYAYQNVDMGSLDLGHLKFLAVGPGCTFKTPPKPRMPDTPTDINWRYYLAGIVNLATGEIEELEEEKK